MSSLRKMNGRRAESPIDLTSSPVPKKKQKTNHGERKSTGVAKRRHAFALAPQLSTHIFFLFAGDPIESLMIHSALVPTATKTYLQTRFHAQQLCYFPEDDPQTVGLWRLYLYTGKVFSDNEATDQDTLDDGDEESHADGEWTKLAHCYFFGQEVRDEGFANACVDALIEKVKETERFPTGIAGEVYGYTRAGDKLRKLIVDLHVWMGQGTCVGSPHEDVDGPEVFQEDFQRENAWAELMDYEGELKWETKPCRAYHEHVLTERCRV